MQKFIWRLRYTIYGQRRCRIGWRNWWGFSAAYESDPSYYTEESPCETAQEEIYQMAAYAHQQRGIQDGH